MSLQVRNLRSRFLLSAVALATVVSASGVAYAQSGGIETVTVTAEKRSENIQNVPIAITAFTGAALQSKNITGLSELSNITPNVTLNAGTPFGGDSSVLSASIRGIGSDDFAFNIDPAVGVYLDGVYLARTIGANQDLLDVKRIEILKGPQGTLFGRNTIGGAISIVTRDPSDHFNWEAQVTTGSRNRRDIDATVDIPISDTVRTSLTISSKQQDGYQHVVPFKNTGNWVIEGPNPHNGGVDQHSAYGGTNRQAVRGKLVWEPSDRFKATVTADWTHEDQEAQPVTVLQTFPFTPAPGDAIAGLYTACINGASGVIPGVIDFDTLCGLRRADGWPSQGGLPPLNSGANYLPINPYTTQTGNIDTTYASGPNFAKFDNEGAGITLRYDLTPDITLKSITGYRHITWHIGTNLDGSPENGVFLNVTDKQRQQQFSEELQAVGTALNDRLHWVAGLYYFYEDGFVHDWVSFDGGLLTVDDKKGNLLATNNYAAYTHLDYKLTDKIGITLGARYSMENKKFLGGQQDDNGLAYKASGCYPPTASGALIGAPAFLTCQEVLGFPSAAQPFRYFPPGWNKRNFYELTPTAGAQYHWNKNLMLYFRWSKGFKSGGWTTRLSAPILDGTQAEYGPEKATSYEGGFKSEWFDHRLVLNGAGFYSRFTQIQLNQQVAASPVLKNLGDADIFGGELEAQADVGHGFMLNANVGYIDAEYTYLDPSVVYYTKNPPVGVEIPQESIYLNSKLPKTPKWKFSINPQYNVDLGNGRFLMAQMTWTHTSSMYNDTLNTQLLKRPTTDTIDASVQVSFDNDKYAITAGGKNITDERYITVGSINYAAGFVDATYNPPAEWYLSLRVKQ